MILQALNDYYHRRCADPDPARHLPAYGLERKEIGFILELDSKGLLKAVVDTRSQVGNKKVGAAYLVPKGEKKTSGIAANLLWDNAEYVLAVPDAKKLDAASGKGKADDYMARLQEMQSAFRQRIEALPEVARADTGISAVLSFLGSDPQRQAAAFASYAEVAATNSVLTFRLIDDVGTLVSQRPGVAPYVLGEADEGDEHDNGTDRTPIEGICLVTGTTAPVARLHTAIKGVWGAQTSGANIVSFNLDAFASYGLVSGANAPVGRAAAFSYTTALNALLARESTQRVQVGDASTVFWAQKLDPLEDTLAQILGGDNNPDAHVQQVKALYEAIRSGAYADTRGSAAFYVLGLAPNAARISVRFWYAEELRTVARRIAAWFDDIQIARADFDPEFPSLRRLLAAACLSTNERPQGDIDRLPPTIAGDLVRSIFYGGEIPSLLLNNVVQRCRAEQARKDGKTGKPVCHVSHARAALMKAAINRHQEIHQPKRRRISMSLDAEMTDRPYVMGRLFAVYERTQEAASDRELNKTIRDAYFGAAMSMPSSVFPRLMRLNQIHLREVKRAQPKSGRYLDKLILSINEKINPTEGYPRVLLLHDQAKFALGYYHQRQDFFTRKDAANSDAADATETHQGGN